MRKYLALAALLISTSALAQNVYPPGAAPITISAAGTTLATTATMAAPPSQTNYLCGFSIRALATAAINGTATVTGLIGGTLSYAQFVAPLASGIGVLEQSYNPCLAATYNTAIAVNAIAAGSGGVTTVNVWGYSK